jgi:NADPH2 dehydrogenase
MEIPRIASLKTPTAFRAALARCGANIDFDETVEHGPDAPLARPFETPTRTIGNRFAILPMEGWDGEADGKPSDLTRRRWQRFGGSGAKLIWGGEAVSVRLDGRASPNELVICDANLTALEALRETLCDEHLARFGRVDDLFVGLQLTHSGRYSRPNDKRRLEPKTLYHHPMLDRRLRADETAHVFTDDEVKHLIDDFIRAACQAQKIGFSFVDIKHCHAYIGHEFLSAVDRPGLYGGSFENRTRFLREVVAGIRSEAPGLELGVRLSVLDTLPFHPGPDGRGEPEAWNGPAYRYAFGSDATGLGVDLTEPSAFLNLLESLEIRWVCTTAGTPYYNPHLLRPAAFPPSDGYGPPEDPLVGVARHLTAARQLKAWHPRLNLVGSGYSYLQEWLPHVAQRVLRDGGADFIGIGRMVLSYPDLPADVLAGRTLARKSICRTFSDCTTGPRNGLISGCFPLDPFYKARPEREVIAGIRRTSGAGTPEET